MSMSFCVSELGEKCAVSAGADAATQSHTLTVDDVMSVVNDTIANTCFEAYPVMILNDTRMVAVACLLGLIIAIILGALLRCRGRGQN